MCATIPQTTKNGESLMAYVQITSEERYTIGALRREGLNFSEIAHRLGRHRSSISREVARNSCRADGAYRPYKANMRTNGRRSRSRRNRRFSPEQWALVEERLLEGWSPEQISGRFKRDVVFLISHETIYAHVWRDKKAGGSLFRALRQVAKLRRKRHNSRDSRGRLAGKRHISERPDVIETRTTEGHWEGDTVVGVGSKHCVATLVERKTGYTLIGKLRDRKATTTTARLNFLIRRERGPIESITVDNGTEFHDYAAVEKATQTTFYFATPYHSWERGTNENFNGLLREYLPKGTDLEPLTQKDCDLLAKILNDRPRKRLGFRTPKECFHA